MKEKISSLHPVNIIINTCFIQHNVYNTFVTFASSFSLHASRKKTPNWNKLSPSFLVFMTAQVTGGSLQWADWHEHQLPKDQPFHIVLLSMIKFPSCPFPLLVQQRRVVSVPLPRLGYLHRLSNVSFGMKFLPIIMSTCSSLHF